MIQIMSKTHYLLFMLLTMSMTYSACSSDEECCDPEIIESPSFDREAMLKDWADDIVIPSFENYSEALGVLKSANETFISAPTIANLESLRSRYIEAYASWQSVSLFDIGKAESIALRNFSNIYPTSIDKITSNITAGGYNLELPSNFVAQGFPALDYLMYGMADDDEEIVEIYNDAKYATYLTEVINRLDALANEVLADWKGSYREDFIANQASSATGSIDKLVNDAIFYYEKFLRAGKIGIPAGVFSGNTISDAVEAPYSGIYSKQLFDEGLNSFQDFFNGKSLSRSDIKSLRHYLDAVDAQKDGVMLSQLINNQIDKARTKSNELDDNLKQQVVGDNAKMLETYDELQKVVVLLKVDMLQALNIKVDFVDADGD